MLNSRSYSNNSLKINAVAGTIAKSQVNSKFTQFELRSPRANAFFDIKNPHYMFYDRKVEIVVLQTMLCGDNQVLVEFIETKDLIDND